VQPWRLASCQHAKPWMSPGAPAAAGPCVRVRLCVCAGLCAIMPRPGGDSDRSKVGPGDRPRPRPMCARAQAWCRARGGPGGEHLVVIPATLPRLHWQWHGPARAGRSPGWRERPHWHQPRPAAARLPLSRQCAGALRAAQAPGPGPSESPRSARRPVCLRLRRLPPSQCQCRVTAIERRPAATAEAAPCYRVVVVALTVLGLSTY
jgi:hypothetical protein